jgi:uncharacterized membrane protein YgcG
MLKDQWRENWRAYELEWAKKEHTPTWDEIQAAFKQMVGQTEDDATKSLTALMSKQVVQQPSQSVTLYQLNFEKHRMIASADVVTEPVAVQLFLSGLRPELHQACRVNRDGKEWATLAELVQYALGEEKKLAVTQAKPAVPARAASTQGKPKQNNNNSNNANGTAAAQSTRGRGWGNYRNNGGRGDQQYAGARHSADHEPTYYEEAGAYGSPPKRGRGSGGYGGRNGGRNGGRSGGGRYGGGRGGYQRNGYPQRDGDYPQRNEGYGYYSQGQAAPLQAMSMGPPMQAQYGAPNPALLYSVQQQQQPMMGMPQGQFRHQGNGLGSMGAGMMGPGPMHGVEYNGPY